MNEVTKETRINEIENRIKNLKSKLKTNKSPVELRAIRSNIGRLEKEMSSLKGE